MIDKRKRIVIDEPESEVAYKYFNIADRIKYYSHKENIALMFVSENEKEGKSTIATNVAIALARKGARVIFVDADIENPSIHDTFNFQLRNGISDAIASDRSILTLVYDTPVYGLSIIHAGLESTIGNEMFLSNRFSYIIGTLKNKYDYTIIDAGMSMKDKANLDAIKHEIDAAIIVQNKERYQLETDSIAERLEEAGVEILGVVNNFDER